MQSSEIEKSYDSIATARIHFRAARDHGALVRVEPVNDICYEGGAGLLRDG